MSEYSASYPLHPTHTSVQDMLANTQPELTTKRANKTKNQQTKNQPKPTNRCEKVKIKPSFKGHQAQCCKVLLHQWSCLCPQGVGLAQWHLFRKHTVASITAAPLIPEVPAIHLGRLWQQFLEQPHSTGHYSLCRQSALSKSWHFSWHLTPHSPQRIPCRAMPHSSPSHSQQQVGVVAVHTSKLCGVVQEMG